MSTSEERLLGSPDDFEEFILAFDNPKFRAAACELSDESEEFVQTSLDTYFSEMRFGYSFLNEHLPAGKLRILEVGAGLGLLSIYLHKHGHDVVALEPAGLSFGLFAVTKNLIWNGEKATLPDLLEKTAEQLDQESDGEFDFIFSINVMEHIEDIDMATDAILSVLKCSGICVNSCPNYLVPYEPHYAIPIVPFAPGMTKKIFLKKIQKQPDIWETLNFISLPKVRQIAKRNNASVEFEKALIYKSFKRLGEDEEFMSRHKDGLVGRMYRVLSLTRLLGLLKFLPPSLSTPMVFTYRLKRQV
ncbi:MAG: class I SAM-dependent methyltransferase [Rhizobiaceae bacterium]